MIGDDAAAFLRDAGDLGPDILVQLLQLCEIARGVLLEDGLSGRIGRGEPVPDIGHVEPRIGDVLEGEGGRLAGRETVRLAKEGAKVGLINFDEPQSCLDRRAGWEEIVKASDKKLQIVEVGNYAGDAAKAEQLMTDALTQNPDLDVVFCVGDPAAAGALAAIKAAGVSTRLIGFDGNPEAKAAMLDETNGKFWVSEISQNPKEIGAKIAEQIVKFLDKGAVDAPVIMIAPYIITAENAK